MLQFNLPEETGPVAINTVGTLTINDGVVTGFNAASNYLQCDQKIDFTQFDYEIAVRVKLTSFSVTTFLFSQGGLTLALGSGSDAGKVELYISLETSGYSEYKQLYTTTLNNIWSLIFKRTSGTRYEVFVATDSGERTLIKTLNTSENIRPGDESNILRWGGGNTFSQYLQGSLYLQGTYATVNGQLWAGKYYQTPEPLGVVIDEGTEINSTDYKIVGNELLEANSSIYLQSNGTQRIDTGVIRRNLTDTYTYKGLISFADVTTRQCVGAQGYFYFGVVNGHYQIAQGGTDYVSGTTAVSNKFVDFDIKFQPASSRADYKIDTYSGAVTNTIFQNTPAKAHINLFSLNDLVLPSSCKIIRFKIYRNDVLLRDFVPVPQGLVIGSYTVPSNGMWDIVNQQFYANSGTGTFEIGKGPRQATYLILNDKLVWANPKIYLQSSGTQYINTGVVPTQIYSYECTYLTTSTNNQVMFGQRSNGDFSSSTDQLYLNANTQNNVLQELIFRGQSSTTRTISTNVKYVSKFTDTRTNLSATTRPLSLMALNNKGTQAAFFVGKMYRLKIDNNGTLLRDFVPVPAGMTIGSYTTPSAGMFDLVNQQFYANAGSGTFTWGKDN